ncbi:PqqD family protein [Ekhidna sp. To15]|uniref:PqqD family protein n=1 Tax=Ekhidna sp. To15 TaxID=3395267 RepID=UPI003F51D5D1
MQIHPKVVSDKFDDEIVVVSLESGFYYSFRKTAMEVWSLIQNGHTTSEVTSSFNLSDSQKKEVLNFLDQLKKENLVVDNLSENKSNIDLPEKLEFDDLEFAKFEDMSDLIMIDPIHDSNQEKGWPNKA